MADTTVLKKEAFIRFKNSIYMVTEAQHVNPGKGSAFTRVRLKDVTTGKTLENTFKTSESVDLVEMDRSTLQYLYKDQTGYQFMDQKSFEQVGIDEEMMGEKGLYLKEGTEVLGLFFEGRAMSIELPKKLVFTITEAMPAVKGDTSSGRVLKEVTLETGLKVQVPIFIEQGERVVVNTETGDYVERATE
jgi:elongation factor P